MSGAYGFSINLELKPTDTNNLVERVNEYLEDLNSNESQLLQEVLIEEDGLISFYGDNEDTWRYDYSPEVLSLISKIENDFGGNFKGEFYWYEYEIEEDTIQKWTFDGNGGIRSEIDTVSNEEEDWED